MKTFKVRDSEALNASEKYETLKLSTYFAYEFQDKDSELALYFRKLP